MSSREPAPQARLPAGACVQRGAAQRQTRQPLRRRFSSQLLGSLRNDLPIDDIIRLHLDLPSKEREGYLRFLCPLCSEFHTATNPKTNLARCFRCAVNFNPIDLVMAVEHCRFVDAVNNLLPLLELRRRSLSGQKTP